eukprot:941994_1
MIGRFGEGLKMAANILLYHKKTLNIITNGKKWKFDTEKGETIVRPRTVTKNVSQIIVTIGGIDLDAIDIDAQYKSVSVLPKVKNYLFLYPVPHGNVVYIEGSGCIILDKDYSHKIYVKGILIGSKKDIVCGYNLEKTLDCLNRDRQLINHQSYIKEIGKLWKHAMLRDEKYAKAFLESVSYGQSREYLMEIRCLSYIDNSHISNTLLKTLGNHLNDEKYFIVSPWCSVEDMEIVNKSKKEPYKVDYGLYKVLSRSEQFISIAKLKELSNDWNENRLEKLQNKLVQLQNEVLPIHNEMNEIQNEIDQILKQNAMSQCHNGDFTNDDNDQIHQMQNDIDQEPPTKKRKLNTDNGSGGIASSGNVECNQNSDNRDQQMAKLEKQVIELQAEIVDLKQCKQKLEENKVNLEAKVEDLEKKLKT